MRSYQPHFRATTAKEEAMQRWAPTQRCTALITALRRIETAPAPIPAPMPRFVDDPTYWRKRGEAHKQGICWKCEGKGEVPVMGILGEYEGTEPCWICQRIIPTERTPLDDIPF